jgi:thioredoxin 1
MTAERKVIAGVLALLLVGIGLLVGWQPSPSDSAKRTLAVQSPVRGMVTMVDFGAGTCVPCKLMAPILEEVRLEYEGRAAIVFIDVHREREKMAAYGVLAIPTQIFFDGSGDEVARHVGFMDKRAITAQLAKLGVE